jgi:hypothetical protein
LDRDERFSWVKSKQKQKQIVLIMEGVVLDVNEDQLRKRFDKLIQSGTEKEKRDYLPHIIQHPAFSDDVWFEFRLNPEVHTMFFRYAFDKQLRKQRATVFGGCCCTPIHSALTMTHNDNRALMYEALAYRCGLDMDHFNLCDFGKLCSGCGISPLTQLAQRCYRTHSDGDLYLWTNAIRWYLRALEAAELYLKALASEFGSLQHLPKVLAPIAQSSLYEPNSEKERQHKVAMVLAAVSRIRVRTVPMNADYDGDEVEFHYDEYMITPET